MNAQPKPVESVCLDYHRVTPAKCIFVVSLSPTATDSCVLLTSPYDSAAVRSFTARLLVIQSPVELPGGWQRGHQPKADGGGERYSYISARPAGLGERQNELFVHNGLRQGPWNSDRSHPVLFAQSLVTSPKLTAMFRPGTSDAKDNSRACSCACAPSDRLNCQGPNGITESRKRDFELNLNHTAMRCLTGCV